MRCDNVIRKSNKKKREAKIKRDARRKPIKQELVLYKRRKPTKTIQKVYNPENIPLFMQYNHLIYKYVRKKYGLSFSKLNLLLFVFPLAPFSRKDFLDCRNVMDYHTIGLMKSFIDDNLFYVWSKPMKNSRVPTLYDLTPKAKLLVRQIHDWALGNEDVPEMNGEEALSLLARIRGV